MNVRALVIINVILILFYDNLISQKDIEVHIVNDFEFSLRLNEDELTMDGPGNFSFNLEDLRSGENHISIVDSKEALNGLTTLDMVLLLRALTLNDDFYTPEMAIAGDVDRSGSITTKDIFLMRKTILGILESPAELTEFFLVEKSHDFSNFDRFQFSNEFAAYEFRNTDLNVGDVLNFEIFGYGDLNSNFVKNGSLLNEPVSMVVENRFVEKGEMIEVKLHFSSKDGTGILGASWRMAHPSLELIDVNTEYGGSEFIWNKNSNAQTTFSVLTSKGLKNIEYTMEFVAHESARLSDLLDFDNTFSNDQVTSAQLEYPLKLTYTDLEFIRPEVYPNPVVDVLRIYLPDSKDAYQISIFNSLGQNILQHSARSGMYELDSVHLGDSKMIFVQISNQEGTVVEKVFVN